MNAAGARQCPPPLAARAKDHPAVLRPEWARLDDEALLAHFRAGAACGSSRWSTPKRRAPIASKRCCRATSSSTARRHRLADPIDWLHNPSVDIEWHILLHKFYYAVGLGLAWQRTGDTRYVRRWRQLLAGWMAARRRASSPPT
jgi:hypothetical protein